MSSEVVLSLQTTLPAAKVGPTTFCFRFLATSNHSEWPDVGKISKAWLTLLCLLDAQTPALKLVTIESLDGACGSRLLSKLDEGKSSRATSIAVGWQVYLCHLANFSEKTFELALRRIVAQVPNKNLCVNDNLLSRRLCTTPVSCSLTY
jgi:hypothetical protein